MSVATPALPVRAERLWAALLAATLMNLPLGSVYAFSVLLRPIEQDLAIPRSAPSLVLGLATVGFTVGSIDAAFLYRVARASRLPLATICFHEPKQETSECNAGTSCCCSEGQPSSGRGKKSSHASARPREHDLLLKPQ